MIELQTIKFIHEYLTEYFKDLEDPIQPPGIKNEGGVESAANRPNLNPEYDTPYLKAASVFHAIINNHPFHNGNKRTALLSAIYYLGEFGILLENCTDEELYEFTRQVAAHEICESRQDEVRFIAEKFEQFSRLQVKGDRPLKFKQLEKILSSFNYELINDGNKCKIINKLNNEETSVKIIKRGKKGQRDFDPSYISELRKRLNLTSEHGVDSMRFYGEEGVSDDLNKFMEIRIEVMKMLAKT